LNIKRQPDSPEAPGFGGYDSLFAFSKHAGRNAGKLQCRWTKHKEKTHKGM